MASSSPKRAAPKKDPYNVLGVEFGATDAEISKAYRQLARTLHPDKLVAQNLNVAQLAQSAIRFQEIQTARSFLLDADHVAARRKYDTQRASDRVRQAANQQRDDAMTERRKRMRDELNLREAQASNDMNSATKHVKAQSQRTPSSQTASTTAALDRQGRALREQYAAKAAAAEIQERDKAALLLQQRQIRLKWSRKKIKAASDSSPSEDSIAKMLMSFGAVDAVQMIGYKGNVALVTFHSESSCTKAVTAYLTSDTWRATHVSKEKQESHEASLASGSLPSPQQQQRDQENVHEWKARQAMEREALLRQMEREDNDDASQVGPSKAAHKTQPQALPFPPPFPDEYNGFASGIDKLERAEDDLLRGLASSDILQRIKVVRTS